MNKFLLILLLGMVAAQVSGQQFLLFQDSIVYVWAEGGLNMRDAANSYEKTANTIYWLPGLSFTEGVLLFKMGILSREMDGAVEDGSKINISKREFSLEFGNGSLSVTAVAGGLIIATEGWC